MDALGDDFRDRFNSTSIVYRFFHWLRLKTGWHGVWAWYRGTRGGGPPQRFLGFPYDYWHSLKHIRNASLAYVCFDISAWWVGAVVFLAAVWFPTLYNNLLISDESA